MGDREEVDVTDTREWRDLHGEDPNRGMGPESGFTGGGTVGSSQRTTSTHPLKVDIPPNSQSPPLWEIVGPSGDDDAPHRVVETIAAQQYVRFLPFRDCISPNHIFRSSKRLIPKSSYYYGPPPSDTAFGTDPIGQIGIHHPREIVRIERDYSGGEIIQFSAVYPLEFEGRVRPGSPRIQQPLTWAPITDNADSVP